MFATLKKRFWTAASARPSPDGFALFLDDRQIKTPAKSSLTVPCKALADAIVTEWMAQEVTIDPASMPMTRRANAAIDKVTPQRADVVEMLQSYGETDLLCYRALHPSELISRQALAWDPVLDWAEKKFGASLIVTSGVIHVAQDRKPLQKLGAPIDAMAPFELTGFHDLVTVSGSLLIALAAISNMESGENLWSRAQVDEIWQVEQWGEDDVAEEQAESAKRDFLDGLRFFRLASQIG